MNSVLQRPFEKMGARVKVEPMQIPVRRRQVINPVELDVRQDSKGEYFSIRLLNQTSVEVLDFRLRDRHLLLLSRAVADSRVQKARYLLGHDERHWFVAAIPEATPVSTVIAAKQALKPETVVAKESGLKNKHKHLRSNKAWIRQGEWFFVPARDAKVQEFLILKREPIARGGGKPHICDELYREGGETVYVSREYPNGLTQQEYAELNANLRSRRTFVAQEPQYAGYWRASRDEESELPWPTPDSSWTGREEFLKALDIVETHTDRVAYRGLSICRICNCRNGHEGLRLAGWEWPAGYRHYIADHQVRPSSAFQDLIRTLYAEFQVPV